MKMKRCTSFYFENLHLYPNINLFLLHILISKGRCILWQTKIVQKTKCRTKTHLTTTQYETLQKTTITIVVKIITKIVQKTTTKTALRTVAEKSNHYQNHLGLEKMVPAVTKDS